MDIGEKSVISDVTGEFHKEEMGNVSTVENIITIDKSVKRCDHNKVLQKCEEMDSDIYYSSSGAVSENASADMRETGRESRERVRLL